MPRTFDIAVIEGDGIGPEVTREAIRAVEAAASGSNAAFRWTRYPWGTDYYLTQGRMAPADFLDRLAAARCDPARRGRASAGPGPYHPERALAADPAAIRSMRMRQAGVSLSRRAKSVAGQGARLD